MNNEQQTWILRKPMKVEFLDDVPGGRYVTDLEIMGLHDYMWNEAQFDEEHFKAQFVPLDVSGLTRQVEELIQTHDYVQAANQPMESNWDLEVTSFAERIVLLLLNQEKETK